MAIKRIGNGYKLTGEDANAFVRIFNSKGKLNGICNRTLCNNEPANWYSSVERAHYCQSCAFRINDALPPGVPALVRASVSEVERT